jgi:hypothetical protein
VIDGGGEGLGQCRVCGGDDEASGRTEVFELICPHGVDDESPDLTDV